ncbi:MAG: hypothetical protein AAF333_00895 [Planctomycetota bacterium]
MFSQPPITDAHYSWDDRWAQLPDDVVWGITHGVDLDPQGNVYVLHTVHETSRCRDAVCVFAPDGSFIRSWGAEFQGSAHGLQLCREGKQTIAYITDLRRGLFKVTLDGEVIWHVAKLTFYKSRMHLAYQPTNVAVVPNGDIFLADGYGSYLIHRFDRDGRELDVFGGPGKSTSHLTHPHGLLYTERRGQPELLVAENINTRLNYLSLEGVHQGLLEVETRRPRHFREYEGVLVMPDFYGRVTLIGADDRLLGHLGDTWRGHDHVATLEASPPARGFIRPHDAAADAHGNLYITECLSMGRVLKLSRKVTAT